MIDSSTQKTLRNTLKLAPLTFAVAGQVAAQAIDADDVDAGAVQLDRGTLTVYLHDHGDAIAARFTEDTGIPVQIVDMSGGEILARIEAERVNPQWDVVYVMGHGSVHRLYEEGILLSNGWQPEAVADYSDMANDIYQQHPDAAWWPVTLGAPALLAYNRDCEGVDQITGWDALHDPQFEGRIGMPNPTISGPAYPYVASFFEEDMEAGYEFWEKVFNNGVRMFRSNSPVAEALMTGELCVAGLEEPNTYGEVEKGENIGIFYPEEGVPGAARAAGISAETDLVEEAQAFIEWMLSAETQEYLTNIDHRNRYFVPVNRHASANDLLPPNEFLNAETQYNFIDYVWMGEVENEIKRWFSDQTM
ncbi:MAG: extracellular solute-binding protein [Natronospirillum sp.]|uniref:ABC transporter substrate-binding protein n=1 Tax=Natronospirillum sp. TaxID=2812955 RepID=UPI0025E5D65A|nr:extracellular solute-binding protein [Natronospirillum sp.]MCH8552545.1 extracellular solute-binding protein [Natronospirillum sp.]